ncbi:hypothetical protein HDA32_002674 [Spinactinospora alkalitolerans]|uniref:Uncharacterized protein n=1 Tax=Spinactinospora alkalitolerans TaxID=687207 RepID=A0A852U016_9ACTN|nr:hypothetical protein [Spinactinospora alkalitolerans]NYE47554.1 hypothetical protein [Spinactinospora alkalitolerans]
MTQTLRCPVADPDKRARQITTRLDSVSPSGLGVACEDAPVETLAHILTGARTARELLNAIELEAARQARERGVTVRTLATQAGISERSATSRYRRVPLESQ